MLVALALIELGLKYEDAVELIRKYATKYPSLKSLMASIPALAHNEMRALYFTYFKFYDVLIT